MASQVLAQQLKKLGRRPPAAASAVCLTTGLLVLVRPCDAKVFLSHKELEPPGGNTQP